MNIHLQMAGIVGIEWCLRISTPTVVCKYRSWMSTLNIYFKYERQQKTLNINCERRLRISTPTVSPKCRLQISIPNFYSECQIRISITNVNHITSRTLHEILSTIERLCLSTFSFVSNSAIKSFLAALDAKKSFLLSNSVFKNTGNILK